VWNCSEVIIVARENTPFLYGSNIIVVWFILGYWRRIRCDFLLIFQVNFNMKMFIGWPESFKVA
jgi:hypothetical protein